MRPNQRDQGQTEERTSQFHVPRLCVAQERSALKGPRETTHLILFIAVMTEIAQLVAIVAILVRPRSIRLLLRCEPRHIVCALLGILLCQQGMRRPTLDLGLVILGLPHQQRRRLSVQRIARIRVAQQLRQEDFEDVDHIEHRRPGLVDHVQADRSRQLVNVRMEDLFLWYQGHSLRCEGETNLVHKTDRGRLVGVLIG